MQFVHAWILVFSIFISKHRSQWLRKNGLVEAYIKYWTDDHKGAEAWHVLKIGGKREWTGPLLGTALQRYQKIHSYLWRNLTLLITKSSLLSQTDESWKTLSTMQSLPIVISSGWRLHDCFTGQRWITMESPASPAYVVPKRINPGWSALLYFLRLKDCSPVNQRINK